MNALRDTLLFGISYLDWFTGLGIGAVTVAGLWALRELMVKRLQGAASTDTWVDDLFLLLARRTSRVYMVAMGVAAAALYETSERDLPTWLRVFTVGALCLQVLRWANAGVDFWVHRMHRNADGTQSSRASLAVVGMLIRALVLIVVVVLALDNFGVNVTALVTGLGITGIAVALAVQNILGDLLAALAIAFDKPFVVGDEITVGDVSGKVESIGLKTTRLRVNTGEQISLANAEVMKTRLTNVSRTETRMVALTVGVSSHGLTGEALLALAARCEAAAIGVAGVRSAKARAWSIVDGRARINVESVLDTPGALVSARPLLIAALIDAASTPERPVLGVS
jgi:small-conductance mechanosensitive channel